MGNNIELCERLDDAALEMVSGGYIKNENGHYSVYNDSTHELIGTYDTLMAAQLANAQINETGSYDSGL